MDDFLDLKQSQFWPVVYRHQKSTQLNSSGKKSDRILTKLRAVPLKDSGFDPWTRQELYILERSDRPCDPTSLL